jgi:hypothetical protein
MTSREQAAPYARERVRAHRDALDAELAAPGSSVVALRNLAPYASPAPLLEP